MNRDSEFKRLHNEVDQAASENSMEFPYETEPDCRRCRDSLWVLHPNGSVVPCEKCQAESLELRRYALAEYSEVPFAMLQRCKFIDFSPRLE